MTTSCAGMKGLLPVVAPRRYSAHGNVAELDALCGRCPSAAPRRPGFNTMGRINASAAPVEASEATTRPTCYKEVWIPPNPSRLIKDKRAFIEEHRIRGYEVGPDQNTTMITIANLFQEVASNHAVAMWGRSEEGFATDPALQKEGLIFVMTRMQIQMDRYPRWGDVVTIETWFMQAGKLGAQRDWVIRDSATGEQLGRATSTWVMINMHTRRLSKLPDFIRERFTYFQLEPPTHAIAAEKTRMKLPDVSDDTATKGPPQVARRSDVDMNGHINNVIYVAWVMETVPSETFDTHLYQLEIDFKAECHSGDVVLSAAELSETPKELASNGAGPNCLTMVHTLQRCEGEACTELVRARTTWRVGEESSA